MSTAATAMVARLMKTRNYADAGRVALLGRRWNSASQAMRYAVARGEIAFTDLFTHELEGVSYREALPDPFLGVAVALSAHGRMLDSAREELLASGVTDSTRVGEHDDDALTSSERKPADAQSEIKLWRATIELVALRALGDWSGLAKSVRTATATAALTPKSALAQVGALRSFLAAQIELALAFLGEPEYRSTERHRRLATALRSNDATWVLGSVALAAAIRGEIAEAKALLRPIEMESGSVSDLRAAEHVSAMALIALETGDEAALRNELDALSRRDLRDPGLENLHAFLEARHAYLRGQPERVFDALRGIEKGSGSPWVHAEAMAFRIEHYLADDLFTQAQAMLEEVQRTPYARWHVIRLALAKSRFAQDQAEAGLKIAESVRVADGATSRNHARALAISVACARRLGDTSYADSLQRDMRFFCLRGALQEPYDDLPEGMSGGAVVAAPHIRPPLPVPLERVELTKREIAVLNALNELNGADEIAVALHVSKNTVKTQLRHIYRKFGVHSREEALRAATEEGLL
ncbi:response regulator transcription factor [Microbacterium sp. A84]|uniref:helix-turn-helix transcriptional regulator n=1 Tax=Microbacterium sp. A84 TaxID=3450715 RepID=UPI003F421025